MPSESGYNNQRKYGKSQYKTIHSVGSSKFGELTAQMYLYDVVPNAIAITDVEVDDIDPKKVYLEIPAHSARVGDVVRILGLAVLSGWEFEVIEVLDANTLAVYNLGEVNGVDQLPEIGDEVKVCRWITAKADPEGALTTSSGPTQFIRNGTTTVVTQDDVTPANNRPLPAGLYIVKDGVVYPVTKDTANPANTVSIPVELNGASGPINITAGDIDIHTTSEGPNFDSMRIGDGSGVYLLINADGSINTKDADVLAELQALNLVDFATETKQDNIITELQTLNGTVGQGASASTAKMLRVGGTDGVNDRVLKTNATGQLEVVTASSALPNGAATEAKQDSIITQLTTLNGTDFATEAKQDSTIVELQTLNGVDFATEAKQDAGNLSLSNIDGKLPATIGQKTGANSLAVVMASDYIPSAPAVPTALTVKNKAVAFGTGAVRLTHDGAAPSATRRKLQFIIEPPVGDVNYFLGSSTVQNAGADRGIRLYPGTLYTYENDAADYYIISDTAAQTVFIVEQE